MGPPIEQSGESTAGGSGGDAHRSLPTPFLTKTYQLVDDPTVDDVISWNDDGSTFVVWRPAEFARDLLPKYFKHNNFSSFVRQLNTYGFRKIVPDRWEFSNDCFKKGEKKLLCDIHRRKNLPAGNVPANRQGSPANSVEEPVLSGSPVRDAAIASQGSGATAGEILEENDKLRRDNFHLRQELSQVKGLLNNILTLMTKYANRAENGFISGPSARKPDLLFPETSPDPHDRRPEVKKEVVAAEEEYEEGTSARPTGRKTEKEAVRVRDSSALRYASTSDPGRSWTRANCV